jgi:DNA-binding NtrC family response regulator
LIVEDEKSLRDLLIRAVTEWEFSATPAWSGEEAVRLNQASPFDIAILDLVLPGVNGIETLDRLRESTPALQGIVLTGSASVEAARKAIHLDVVEFLTKPCNRGELEEAIDRARRRLPAILPAVNPGSQRALQASSTLEEVERHHVIAALERNKWDRRLTARELGISRKTLYNKIKGYRDLNANKRRRSVTR